jgi:glycerophosphoryl diester phosphodiesterase
MSVPLLIHHAANRGHPYPPNSLRALDACLQTGAQVVEVDVTPLADGDFALLHDAELDRATDGSGHTFVTTATQISQLHYLRDGVATDEPVALLSQVVPLIRDHPHLRELQLDLKPHAPLTGPRLQSLLGAIKPIKSQVRISSVADWSIRRLRRLDAGLALGFDPLLYLDVDRGEEGDETTPPYRIGAYGYRDDHPLASRVWGSPADYLAARAEALAVQVPPGVTWYLRASLLAHALDDGFDWIAYLHVRGAPVVAWTLDANQPHQVALARRLAGLGIDRITTNDAPRLAETLGIEIKY